MSRKIKILLEDDNEILGNGLGHPVLRQYLPTKRYIEILNKYNIKSTFYIDMAHYLFLKENEDYKDFKFQALSIIETIKLLVNNKMDVQVHLHSQWCNAEIKNDQIYVSEKWNIGQLTKNEIESLFKKSFAAISNILSFKIDQPILNSFKAGSWGLQPFEHLYDIFCDYGIKLVMGPIKGLKIEKLGVNYSSLHSDFYPYYASRSDINKTDDKRNIVVLPMTPTYLNWFDFIRYLYEIMFFNKFKKSKQLDIYNVADKIKKLKPLKGKDKLNFSHKPFKTHLKINAQKYWYLRNTFRRSYNYIKKSKYSYKLIVIETHSKDFFNTFNDIEKFFRYLKENYHDIEFITSSNIVNDIKSGLLSPLNE